MTNFSIRQYFSIMTSDVKTLTTPNNYNSAQFLPTLATVLRKRKKDGKFIRLITAQYSFLDESIYDTSLNKEYFCVVVKRK